LASDLRSSAPWRPLGGHHHRSVIVACERWGLVVGRFRPSREVRAVSYPGRADSCRISTPVVLREIHAPRLSMSACRTH